MCRRRTPWWLIHASFFTGLLVAAAGGGAPVAVADGSAAAADGPAAVAEGSASADAAAGALPAGWQRREVHWRLPGERKVRAIREPGDRPVPTRDRWHPVRPASRTRTLSAGEREAAARLLRERTVAAAPEAASGPESVSVLIIHSPPIDGFVPHVALLTTNARKSRDYWDASPSLSVLGDYTVANPTLQYGFGIFDTGAGVSVLSFANSALFGLLSSLTYNTGKVVTIGGVTGSVTAWVSQPIGLWMDGLGAINPATLLLDTTNMVGEWNVSVAMGRMPATGAPDLITAIGSPMAVYFTTLMRTDTMLTIRRGGKTYDSPDITFFDRQDPAIPTYPNRVPLELRPTGAVAVLFWPCFEALQYCPGGDGSPLLPSFLIGVGAQSLFFLTSVNMNNAGQEVLDRQKFMLDTGAQITVVSTRMAALLSLDPARPDFTVEIQGVDGQVVDAPGFLIDSMDLPALGGWLSYTHVPVVMLDIASPEGGLLEGIIGMNLLNRYNVLLRGGGLPGMGEPWLDVQPLPGVDADFDDDGDVDAVDFARLQACLSGYDLPQDDAACQMMRLDGDTDIDHHDLKLFVDCASGPGIPAVPECVGQ